MVCCRENEVEEGPKEEVAKEMTLDEWKAVQDKERAAAKVEFNIRKANEGADWKKGYVLHKSKTEDVSEYALPCDLLFLKYFDIVSLFIWHKTFEQKFINTRSLFLSLFQNFKR